MSARKSVSFLLLWKTQLELPASFFHASHGDGVVVVGTVVVVDAVDVVV